MAKRGRPPVMKDPIFIGICVERYEREMLEAFAQLNGHSLTDEMRLAVRKHIRTALDDHADDHADDPRTVSAPTQAGNGALATTTHPKEKEEGGLED